MTYDFQERLTFSTTANGRTFEAIILDTLPGIVSVTKTDTATDKTGIDYVAVLNGGACVFVDLKLRDAGCSKFWNGEEELALELWSVMPTRADRKDGKPGWTWDSSKATHYTLHAFHPADSEHVFILPFQLLRKAFRARARDWRSRYKTGIQESGKWKSECVFVPVSEVLSAIQTAMICQAS